MYSREAFRVLKIEPTENKKDIKKAYANQVKQYHPEEYPEEWKRIHDALDELVTDQKQQLQIQQDEHLKIAIQKLDKLANVQQVSAWEDFFYHQDMEILCRSAFLYKWGDILLTMKISKELYQFSNGQLKQIIQYCSQNGIIPEQMGLIAPFDYIKGRLRNSQLKTQIKKPIGKLILCLLIIVLLRMARWNLYEDYESAYTTITNQMQEEMNEEAEEQQKIREELGAEADEYRRVQPYLDMFETTTESGMQAFLYATQVITNEQDSCCGMLCAG